jgi:hypothetical protein
MPMCHAQPCSTYVGLALRRIATLSDAQVVIETGPTPFGNTPAAPVTMADQAVAPSMVVRLKSRLPDGQEVGERRRECHLVPLPEPGEMPTLLRAFCGLVIAPGTVELLDGIRGMPHEACLAKSGIAVFAMLHGLPFGTGHAEIGG